MTLRRLTYLTLGFTIFVILWGAYVRASGSGAGCGRHWPLCNGVVVPRTGDTKTLIEFTHRVTSGIVLLMIVGLFIQTFRTFPARHRMRLAAAGSLIFVITEALIGAGLVLLELVAENDSALRAGYLALHLTNTFCLLGCLTLVAVWAERPAPAVRAPGRGTMAAGWATLIATLVVGMTGAITALGDTLFPAGSIREGMAQDVSPAAPLLLRLRVVHPVLAVSSVILILGLATSVLRTDRYRTSHAAVRWFATLAVGQLAVGLVNLMLLVPISTQLIHLLVADLLWIAGVASVASLKDSAPEEAAAVAPARPAPPETIPSS